MDAKSHRIFTGDKRLGDVEFMRKTRAAGHSDPLAVDPNNHLGFNALEAQTNLAPQSKPRLRTHEMPRIVADWIIFRRERADPRGMENQHWYRREHPNDRLPSTPNGWARQ